MTRTWNSVCALVALAALLVPPHVCCLRLFAAAPAKACCCCNEPDEPRSDPAPGRQAPCCQKADPATLTERGTPPSGAGLVDALPAWTSSTGKTLRLAWESPESGAWRAAAQGRRTHLLHCRFNC